MNRQVNDEDAIERASTDGRVAFGIAAFAFAALLVALLDRVGVPERLVGVLGPILAICGLATIGLLLRSMRISRFYAAGRAVPSPYAGLALAALFVGLFAPFLPPTRNDSSIVALMAGFGGGGLLACLVTGPLLRKSGAFSLADLLATRFPLLALRLGVVAVVSVVSFFVAAAAYELAVRGLQTGLAMERRGATLLAGCAIVLIALPGGLSGVVWAGMAAAAVLLAGSGLPVAILIAQGGKLPLPVIGAPGAWSAAMARMAAWSSAGPPHHGSGLAVVLAVALGVGVLAPLLAPSVATRDRRAAHSAGRTAILGALVMALVLAVSLAAAALATDAALVGKAPGQLPDYAYAASGRGLLTICGKAAPSPSLAAQACRGEPGFTGVLAPSDIAARGPFLATALPTLRGSGEAFSGLAAAGMVAIALALAAAAFQALATALGHDAFYRVRGTGALTSSRLAVTRGLLLAAVAGTGVALMGNSVDAREMIALAIAFSAAAIAPLLALAFWPRASASDATFALLCGLGAAEAVIISQGSAPTLGILTAGALVACLAGGLAGVASSLIRAPDPLQKGGVFIDRILHGESDVLNPDKGA